MPAWEDYKTAAKSRGALAFELFVAQSVPVAEPDVIKSLLPDHLSYQAELEAAGQLFMAGPMSDETGEQMQSMGLIVYRATSLEQAKALAEADPMHAQGARKFTLRKWLVNEGSLTVSVSLADQRVSLN